jgi:ERCC4-type nuclease
MKIIIDEREITLYDKLLSLCSKTSPQITIMKQVLPLGDIIVEFDNQTTAVIIERKSLSDLISSIRDGRYEEQSYRLIHSSDISRHNIIYIIEGIVNQLQPYDRDLVYATMTSLNFYKGFSVIRTTSIQDTAEYIKTMAVKMQKNTNNKKFAWNHYDSKIKHVIDNDILNSHNSNIQMNSSYTITSNIVIDTDTCSSHPVLSHHANSTGDLQAQVSEPSLVVTVPSPVAIVPPDNLGQRASISENKRLSTSGSFSTPPPYCSVVKKVKKDNITPANIGEIVLCQIPGISSVSAVAIMKKFGTIRNLIDVVTKDPNCMKDLYTTSSVGNRKLGSNITANIKKYLIGDITP